VELVGESDVRDWPRRDWSVAMSGELIAWQRQGTSRNAGGHRGVRLVSELVWLAAMSETSRN
jgi:hypothetical protein